MKDLDRKWQIHVDASHGGILAGWACEITKPNAPVILEVSTPSGDRLVAVADGFRADLQEAGYGNGKHAFHIDVSQWTLADKMVRIKPIDDMQGDFAVVFYFDLVWEMSRQPWIEDYDHLLLPIIKNLTTVQGGFSS